MQAGVHETDSLALVEEALACDLEFVHVDIDPEEHASLREGVANLDASSLVTPEAPIPNSGGPLTLDDTDPAKLRESLICGHCDRTKPFANRGALQAHRKARHPDVDPETGELREAETVEKTS
jgi:hypothetical protein